MRTLLTASGLAVMLLCAIVAAAADVTARTPIAPVLISGSASTRTTGLQDRPPPSDEPSSADRGSARFVDLWVVIAGAVGLLLVGRWFAPSKVGVVGPTVAMHHTTSPVREVNDDERVDGTTLMRDCSTHGDWSG